MQTRPRWPLLMVLAIALGSPGSHGCESSGADVAWQSEQPSYRALEPHDLSREHKDDADALKNERARAIEPLPQRVPGDPDKVRLGELLFADVRLSGDQQVACTHCHMRAHGGANGEAFTTLAARKKPVPVNVPTLYNAAFQFRYGWDGRFSELEQLLDFAMGSAAAMASSFALAVSHLRGDASLQRAFAASYPLGLSEQSLRDALASYCRAAVTPDARFDRYLRGELELSERELRGYQSFRDYGCISCHQGTHVGGNMYQRFGVMRPYFTETRPAVGADLGRFNTTHDERDRHVFRVPSLRNVARTAPYFHDGSVMQLEEAVRLMAFHQLGRALTALEIDEIVAFLRTLTGEYRGRPL